jgi:hypothetical protein
MLLRAILHAVGGAPVLILARGKYAGMLRGRARSYCVKLDIDPKLILLRKPKHEDAPANLEVLCDHFLGGRDV